MEVTYPAKCTVFIRLEFVLSSMEVTYNAISKDDYKTKEFPIFRYPVS